MSVRLRRLKADYDRISTTFGGKSRIKVLKTVGNPPEKYQIEFLINSVQKDNATGTIRSHNHFIAEIVLTGAYPRMAPQCKMLTPIYHPNIAPHAICVGDHWAAGESLGALIVRIGEMISYQSYNVKSPLNGDAARWVEKNQDKLPLDNFDFTSMLTAGEALGRNSDGSLRTQGAECANCGKKSEQETMKVCQNGHVTCSECEMSCGTCDAVICLKCNLESCAICKELVCTKCMNRCASCGRLSCSNHTGVCVACEKGQCADCLVTCQACGQPVCVEHIKKVMREGQKYYVCETCCQPAGA